MRKLSKIFTVLLCSCLALGTFMIPAKAHAADAKTYVVRYSGSNWFYEAAEGKWNPIGSLDSYLKDGDNISIDDQADGAGKKLEIELTKSLGQIAVSGSVSAVIKAPKADCVYGVNGGVIVFNGYADKVICNPGNTVQINGNAGYVEANYVGDVDDNTTHFAITGTVAHFKGRVSDGKVSPAEAYDIPAGKCVSDDMGYVWLKESELKTAPSTKAETTKPVVTAKELDDVPKTGLSLRGTAICLIISAILAFAAVMVSGMNRKTEM